MRTLEQHLVQYARYHRDRRNIATHLVGIPLIVLGLQVLLARARLDVGGAELSGALLATLGALGFYLRLDRKLAALTGLLLGAGLLCAERVAQGPFAVWLAIGAGLFIVGWAIQFVGHVFERRRPAFVDDLVGLLIGPLFVVVELGGLFGAWRALRRRIEAQAGPLRGGRLRSHA